MENEEWAVQIVPFYKTKMVILGVMRRELYTASTMTTHPLSVTRRELYTGAAHNVTRRKLCTDSYKSGGAAEERRSYSHWRRSYRLSVLPDFLLPASKCLGLRSNTCLSASPFLLNWFIFLWDFFIITLACFAIFASQTPDWSLDGLELLRLRVTDVGGSESPSLRFLWRLLDLACSA